MLNFDVDIIKISYWNQIMKYITVLFVFLSITVCFYGQNKQKNTLNKKNQLTKENYKLDQSKPTVYIDFVKVLEDEPFEPDDSRERVYLKLVNNSKWSIYIPVFAYIDESKGTGIEYAVERVNDSAPIEGTIPQTRQTGDMVTPHLELKYGKSITFSVPSNHLAINLIIRVDFYYSWVWDSFERDNSSDFLYPEIISSVYFTNPMLEKLRKK